MHALQHPRALRSLDYPGVGPEHSFLRDAGRAEYHAVTDTEALAAFQVHMVDASGAPSGAFQCVVRGREGVHTTKRVPLGGSELCACACVYQGWVHVQGAAVSAHSRLHLIACWAPLQLLSRLEGIIPALETSHAIAYLDKLAPTVRLMTAAERQHCTRRARPACPAAGCGWVAGSDKAGLCVMPYVVSCVPPFTRLSCVHVAGAPFCRAGAQWHAYCGQLQRPR